MVWVSTSPPASFAVLGVSEPLWSDAEIDSNSYGPWEFLQIQVLSEWRWKYDREAVLSEDMARAEVMAAQAAERRVQREKYLASVTLDDLLSKELLAEWERYPPEEEKEGSRRILRTFIQSLKADGTPADPDIALLHLESCVVELNRFDAEHDHFIETVEREDLCSVIEEILYAAKVPKLFEEIDEWRDW